MWYVESFCVSLERIETVMAVRHRNQKHSNGQKNSARIGKNRNQNKHLTLMRNTAYDQTQPETQDTGDGISEGSVYDASGAATGGGVDTPTVVDKSTESVVRRKKPINQGDSAYTGGGADNGSNL